MSQKSQTSLVVVNGPYKCLTETQLVFLVQCSCINNDCFCCDYIILLVDNILATAFCSYIMLVGYCYARDSYATSMMMVDDDLTQLHGLHLMQSRTRHICLLFSFLKVSKHCETGKSILISTTISATVPRNYCCVSSGGYSMLTRRTGRYIPRAR